MNLADIAEGLSPEIAPVVPAPEQMPEVRFQAGKVHGWLEVGHFYTCIPDPAYPWDPAVLKEIWKLAPDAVPMWVHWVFKTPPEDSETGTRIFGRHALGRKIWHPKGPVEEFRVEMPTMPCQGVTFEKPNKLWFIHMGESPEKKRDLPGAYLGFDASLLDRVRDESQGFKMSDAEYLAAMKEALIEGPRRRRDEKRKAFQEELDYAQKDLERYAAKILDGVSDVEIQEYIRAAGHRKREPKPMVIVP